MIKKPAVFWLLVQGSGRENQRGLSCWQLNPLCHFFKLLKDYVRSGKKIILGIGRQNEVCVLALVPYQIQSIV
ncbi:Hypothetical protein LUCI_4338 [Lucifera butyrica]|uniref:Uncharacterized protein n=1 Tax=Lucifera butyrica TaxID=1351585 RepID=A0A498RG47_9FIRM|nr:Hypothetical protein LUCI_4338 [Lucifera butyrica]